MPSNLAMYRIFIASPGGLAEERKAFRDAIADYNESDAVHRGVLFRAVGWEATLPGMGRPQELINSDIRDCDLFVLLLWDRWGTASGLNADGREYSSGTEEEYSLAVDCLGENDKPLKDISIFFKLVEMRRMSDPGAQLQKVIDFKEKLESEKQLLYQTFDDASGFKIQLTKLLAKWLRDHELDKKTNDHNLKEGPQITGIPSRETSIEELPSRASKSLELAYESMFAGYLTSAAEIFRKILDNSEEPQELVEAMTGLATLRQRQGQFYQSIKLYRDAASLSAVGELDKEERVRILVGKGAAEIAVGKIDRARHTLELAESLADEIPSPIVKAFAIEYLSSAYSVEHCFVEAQSKLVLAQNIRQASGEEKQLQVGRSLDIKIAIINVGLGNFIAARNSANIIELEHDREMLEYSASWPRLKAWIAWRAGNRTLARDLFIAALNVAETRYSDRPLDQIPFFEDLALFFTHIGEYRGAEYFGNRVTDSVKEVFRTKHPLFGIQSLSLGFLYVSQKGYEQAEQIARTALGDFDELRLSNSPRKATAEYILGVALSQMGRSEYALDCFESANRRLEHLNSNMPIAKEIKRFIVAIRERRPIDIGKSSQRKILVGPQNFSRFS